MAWQYDAACITVLIYMIVMAGFVLTEHMAEVTGLSVAATHLILVVTCLCALVLISPAVWPDRLVD